MASQWSIIINQLPNGALTFTPDVAGAKVGQPLGVNKNDNVTWNNRTNHVITLQSIQPPDPPAPAKPIFPFDSIPAGSVSNPIFNVAETVEYSGVIVPAKPGTARKGGSRGPTPAQPRAWIVVQ